MNKRLTRFGGRVAAVAMLGASVLGTSVFGASVFGARASAATAIAACTQNYSAGTACLLTGAKTTITGSSVKHVVRYYKIDLTAKERIQFSALAKDDPKCTGSAYGKRNFCGFVGVFLYQGTMKHLVAMTDASQATSKHAARRETADFVAPAAGTYILALLDAPSLLWRSQHSAGKYPTPFVLTVAVRAAG